MSKPDLTGVIDRLRAGIENDPTPDSLTFGEVLDAIGRRAYGPLLLLLGLLILSPATIVPGVSWAFAALVILIAGQLAFGKATPWLPRRLLRIALPRTPLLGFLNRVRPRAEKLDRSGWLQTRLPGLSEPPLVSAVALAIIAAASVIFPLGLIPFATIAPALAIVFFGVGMTARDGLWLFAGMAFFVAAICLSLPLIQKAFFD